MAHLVGKKGCLNQGVNSLSEFKGIQPYCVLKCARLVYLRSHKAGVKLHCHGLVAKLVKGECQPFTFLSLL